MTGPKSRAKPKAIQSVNRAMDILEALNQREEPANLTELSTILGLNKTTLFHLIKTLLVRSFGGLEHFSLKRLWGMAMPSAF